MWSMLVLFQLLSVVRLVFFRTIMQWLISYSNREADFAGRGSESEFGGNSCSQGDEFAYQRCQCEHR